MLDITKVNFPITGIVQQNMCFRECVKIIKIAEETGCIISFMCGNRKADTNSLLSLVKLELTPGQTIVIQAEGDKPVDAYKQCLELLSAKIEL